MNEWRANAVLAVLVVVLAWVAGCGRGGPIPPAQGQDAVDTISWTAPTQRVDGSPLPASEIASYRFSWGRSPAGPFDLGSASASGSASTLEVPRPLDGRRCYVGVTIDTTAQESDPSSPAACTEKCPLGQRIQGDGSCALPGRPQSPGGVGVS